ncbi:hypothetical protein D7U91_12455 [Stenotrophomonas maltophilia]|nr:hypothetical protein [Stenotrophomonas maltophilia]MBA0393368.1 hypothetical protein [Stenotrophomonas maltophilia]MBA0465282.1 hypothetical protein [Stenotrophomonas maltophilia]MBA0474321.1 hypothetical protein [Stenotrophomonas maltophilia]
MIYGAAQLAAMAAAIASRYVPKTSLELRTPRKVSDAGFAVIREGIVQLVLGGVGLRQTSIPGPILLVILIHFHCKFE